MGEAVLFTTILVCYDGSPSSKKALRAAVQLAKDQGAALCCLSVEEGLPTYAGTIDEFAAVKEERDAYYSTVHAEARHVAAEYGVPLATRLKAGHPATTLVR